MKDCKTPGFYSVKWGSDTEYPILSHHRKSDGKLTFTDGIGIGVYWFEEIDLFLKMAGLN